MRAGKFSRRDMLKASGAAAMTVFATPLRAAAPEPTAITPALIAAATKEGKVVYYTSIDLPVSEKIAKAFEAKYPGISVRVERTGAERVFQRIGQEYASNIHAVDVVNSSDAAHFIVWKRDGVLAPFVPEDVAKYYPADQKDPDGQFASFRVCLSVIGYNTNLVKACRCAEELRRPARSEMGRQDRQGPSGLQRHHHDLDLRDGARPRLGLFREARQAARHAGAVRLRSAQEDRPRRARDHGRRQRLRPHHGQGRRRAGGDRLSDRRHARRSSARTRSSRPRPTRTRRGCSRRSASPPNASSSCSTSPTCTRSIRW